MLDAQRRKAQRESDDETHDGRDRYHQPERDTVPGREYRRDVRTDAEERRLPERHLPRIADGEVQAERRHQVDAAQRQQVDLAALQQQRRRADRDDDRDQQQKPPVARAHTLRSSLRPSRPSGRNRITSRNSTSATPSL